MFCRIDPPTFDAKLEMLYNADDHLGITAYVLINLLGI